MTKTAATPLDIELVDTTLDALVLSDALDGHPAADRLRRCARVVRYRRRQLARAVAEMRRLVGEEFAHDSN